ncbi:MAG TPA: SGNH/GDSL hydrolase family protein, partial [Myxococcota bacterium]|nr:SGNH/GDSL hydrolase family protein [Myxococcota bacterium]
GVGPNLRFVGRFDTGDPNAPSAAWPGSQIVAGFTGSAITVTLEETEQHTYQGQAVNNYYDVFIDGGDAQKIKLNPGKQVYKLAEGLSAGPHTIRLFKRTETQIGITRFWGFAFPSGGGLAPGPGIPERRIEFVGDSGTAGYGADANVTLQTMCTFSASTESATISYPAQTAALLQADHTNISYSGKGLVQNRDPVNDAVKTLPVMWERTFADAQPEVPWDHSKWQPQAVVLTVGGNDFFASFPPEAQYTSTTVAFLKRIWQVYPKAHVFMMVSPMIRDRERPTATRYAQSVASSAGDERAHYIDVPTDTGANGYGCDMHLTPKTNAITAQAIAEAIRPVLGW